MVPRLGDDACRFEQHGGSAQRRIDLDEKFRFDAETVGPKTVSLFDAPLGVTPVTAHVPFADGASRTRNGIGAAHDADNEVADFHIAAGRRLFDPAEELVTYHQTLRPVWRPTIVSRDDFAIRPADAQRQCFHQH